MLIALLGSAIAFIVGTNFTQRRILEQQLGTDAERVTEALQGRVEVVQTAAELLAHDPDVVAAAPVETEAALRTLNGRAVVVRERFNLDLIQIYNPASQARTNLLLSNLFRETSLLAECDAGAPTVQLAGGQLLLIHHAAMPEGAGHVVVGIDMARELERLVAEYRLPSELGISAAGSQIATRENFPFEAPERRMRALYVWRFELQLGETPVELLLTRPTTEVRRVTNTGLKIMIGSTLLTTALLMGLSLLITHGIARPIQHLSSTADAVAKGDLSRRVNLDAVPALFGIGHEDEIGLQARAFNEMVAELSSLYTDLEAKVEARTQELAATAEVARAVSSSLDLKTVLQTSTCSIRERFDFYLVAIFTVDPGAETLRLREAIGKGAGDLVEGGLQVDLASRSILGAAVSSGQPQVSQFLALEPVMLRVPQLPDQGSAAAIPLRVGASTMGILYVQITQSDAFTEELTRLLTTLADQIAVGMENSRLYETEQQRRHLAETLEMTGRSLVSNLDLEEIPEQVLLRLAKMVPYERGVLLFQRDAQFVPLASYGFSAESVPHFPAYQAQGNDLIQQIVVTQKPVIIEDAGQEGGSENLAWLPADQRSLLGAPLISRDEVIGLILLTRREVDAFSLEDVLWIQTFTMQAGIALENAYLYGEVKQLNEYLEQLVEERTRELNRAYHSLEKLDKTKSDFIAVAAHELRTPLTVIKGYTQILEKLLAEVLPDHTRKLLDGVLSGADRLEAIVSSMLDIARIDNQTLQLYKSKTRIIDILTSIQETLAPTLRERRMTMSVSGVEGLPMIEADPDLLKKVFHHLIFNAVKYTPDGGKISVTGSIVEDEETCPWVQVVVSDTGIGIDPEHHELIFEKFYQTGEISLHSSSDTKFKGGGPGLGLAIVRGLVSVHGGRIWVESEGYDEVRCPGSHFYVQLPLHISPEQHMLAVTAQEVKTPVT
jgi:signal transduction histidine kinase/HAMP domain-containing protein